MDDVAVQASDRIEAKVKRQLVEMYSKALQKSIKNRDDFFKKMDQIDRLQKKLPASYTVDQILEWRQGFIREALRQYDVIASIANDLARVGGQVPTEIKGALGEIYSVNRAFTIERITEATPVTVRFTQYDKRQIQILMDENSNVFLGRAYRKLGSDTLIAERLRAQLAQAIQLGESHSAIVDRVRTVTNISVRQANTIVQTGRTRVQSQARAETISEAARAGVHVRKEWSTRMINSRETHVALDGQIQNEDEPFELIDGDRLMYPGDPNGAPENTVNCFCVLIPVVGE